MSGNTILIQTKLNTDGTITAANSITYTPKVQFGGGEIKWYEDTYKKNSKKI